MTADIISLINFRSKLASAKLAETRGSCEAMRITEGNEYADGTYFATRYAPTDTVTKKDLLELDSIIKGMQAMRNIGTLAFSPTGTLSRYHGVSPSIDPPFEQVSKEGVIRPAALKYLDGLELTPEELAAVVAQAIKERSFQNIAKLPESAKNCLKSYGELTPTEHLLMLKTIQDWADDSISKTIPVPEATTQEEIREILELTHRLGVKGITVYRFGSHQNEPIKETKKA